MPAGRPAHRGAGAKRPASVCEHLLCMSCSLLSLYGAGRHTNTVGFVHRGSGSSDRTSHVMTACIQLGSACQSDLSWAGEPAAFLVVSFLQPCEMTTHEW